MLSYLAPSVVYTVNGHLPQENIFIISIFVIVAIEKKSTPYVYTIYMVITIHILT